jgi:predicted nucleic acid-binding protein
LQRAKRDVADQECKLRDEHEVIERLKTIRAHNGLADALYIALTRRGGAQ